jgi:hypothetical protein
VSFPFPVEPVLRAVNPNVCDGRQQYVLVEDFPYQSAAFGAIVAPTGMTTDFASVPRIVWSYLSPEDPVILFGSLIHDYLYSVLGRLPLRTLTRSECDSVLREAMLACGARATQAAVVHRVVRLFGGSHWKSP